jgi:hypothetical protein
VILGLALMGTASAQADEVKDWLADHPSAFVAAVGGSVAATTNAVGLRALSKVKPIPGPALALASPAGALNEAQLIYRRRSESYSQELIGTEEAIKNREKSMEKLRAEYHKLADDNMPIAWKRKVDIKEEINAHKKHIEALQLRSAQLSARLELSIKKASEVEAYVKSGVQGRFLTQNDHKFLDPFKNRYSLAAKEYARLTQAEAKKLATRSEIKRGMLYGNLVGLVGVPAVGAMALVGSNGVNEERREKAADSQFQRDEAKVHVESVNAAAH